MGSQERRRKHIEKGKEWIGKLIPYGSAAIPAATLAILNKNGQWSTEELIVAVITGACAFGTALIVAFYIQDGNYSRIEETMVEIEGRYNAMLKHYSDQLQRFNAWYYSHQSLNFFERALPKEAPQRIWVVSRKLEYESDDGLFAESIRQNLRSGWQYEYIIPNHREVRGIAKQRKNEWDELDGKTGEVTVWLLDDKDFDYLSDLIVYNPPKVREQTSQKLGPTKVFMELLTSKIPADRGWLLLPGERVQEVTDHILAHRRRAEKLD